MTLSGTTLFPHAMLPLYIFEPRYRQMLEDVLSGPRLFVVAGENSAKAEETGEFEPPFDIAGLGVVRASHKNPDETSNLIVQGLCRVRFKRIVQEEPYRVAEFEALKSIAGADEEGLLLRRDQALELLEDTTNLGAGLPDDLLKFLESLSEPETFLDLAIFTACTDGSVKQLLLEDLNTADRFEKFCSYLKKRNDAIRTERTLRGKLGEDEIGLN